MADEPVMFDDWIERLKRLGFHAIKLDEPQIINPTDGFGGTVRIELWWYIADKDGENCNGTPWQTEALAWEHVYVEYMDAELLETRNELADFNDEDDHKRADECLIRALRALADEDTETIVEDIIAKYEAVPKWYA